MNVFSASSLNASSWKIIVLPPNFICTESQRAHTNVSFSQFNLSHKLRLLNLQHNFCSVMCYTILILISLNLRNNILLNHLIDLNNCITFRLYLHLHSTTFESQNSHSTIANIDQLRHITQKK